MSPHISHVSRLFKPLMQCMTTKLQHSCGGLNTDVHRTTAVQVLSNIDPPTQPLSNLIVSDAQGSAHECEHYHTGKRLKRRAFPCYEETNETKQEPSAAQYVAYGTATAARPRRHTLLPNSQSLHHALQLKPTGSA